MWVNPGQSNPTVSVCLLCLFHDVSKAICSCHIHRCQLCVRKCAMRRNKMKFNFLP
jgi:hypothetical protein